MLSMPTVALMALKRKRAYEDQISKIMGSRMTLETQVMAIENANVNLETMNAMKAGADAMKQIHGSLYAAFVVHSIGQREAHALEWRVYNRDINKVDNTMDDIREQMDLANEISDAISQPVGFGVEFDEDELNEELELLEQQELDELLLEKGEVSTADIRAAPSVPSTAVPGTCLIYRSLCHSKLKQNSHCSTTETNKSQEGNGRRRRVGRIKGIHGHLTFGHEGITKKYRIITLYTRRVAFICLVN